MISDAAKVILQTATVVFLLLVILIWWRWDWITSRDVRADLNDYGSAVRRSACPLQEKERLLDQIDALKDLLDVDATIGSSRWKEIDEAVRELIKYNISAEDTVLIARELNRAKREMENR
jgi:hypothetical protein